MINALLCSLLLATTSVYGFVERKHFGFGAQRLKKNSLKGEGNATTCPNVEQYWFKGAVVDNFASAQDVQYWAGNGQRYWINKQFWAGPGAPIFVFIGGEGQESCSRLGSRMYVFDLAKQHNALMVNVEHRYYGESYPTTDMSTDNLKKYLSSQQALADLSRLIMHVKNNLDTMSSKV